MNGLLENMARFKVGRSKRTSSYDRTGGNGDAMRINAGETLDIARIDGAGIIKHIWFTTSCKDPMYYRKVIIRMYWDGEKKPSVEVPLGDFFGQGWGEIYTYVALPLCASPKRSVNSYFPMPFADGARIEIENQCEENWLTLYYYVDYEEREFMDDDMGRFHSTWRRRLNAPPQKFEFESVMLGTNSPNLTDEFNHLFIDAVGKGHYVGVNYFVDSPTPGWYGEGDDMFFIDGEPWPPSLHGTGTEDYFNSSYCPKVIYTHPYFGYARVNDTIGWFGRTHCYRFHVEDPVIFTKSLRGSIEAGHANDITSDLVTVSYWYQTEPHKVFPAFPKCEARMNMPTLTLADMCRWREVWRQAVGGGVKWGNEPLPKKFLANLTRMGAPGRKKMAPAKNIVIAKREKEAQEKMFNRRKKGGKRK